MSYELMYEEQGNTRLVISGDESALDNLKTITKKSLMKAIEEEVEELNQHFTEDGWDIRADGVIERILYNASGFHINESIRSYINAKLGTVTEFSNDNPYAVIAKPRTFVYYDAKKDKVVASKKVKSKLEYIGTL